MFKLKRTTTIGLILIGIILLISLYKPSSPQQQEICKNPTKIEDYTDRDLRLTICKDSIKYGDATVTTKKENPDLFGYKFNDEETWDVTHEVAVYKIDNVEFIAIFPVVNPYTWYMRSGYIFQKTDDSYKLIFERDFKSLSGRWTGVRFDENSSVFSPNVIVVNQDLGPMGPLGQRIRWSDYYEWNTNKKSYVLANNTMGFRMKELSESYEELDLTACGNESPELEGKSISELYQVRYQNDHFCDDDSPVPYISNKEAALFLKAKKALAEISEGNNFAYNDIEKIKIE